MEASKSNTPSPTDELTEGESETQEATVEESTTNITEPSSLTQTGVGMRNREDYVCAICMDILIDAVQTGCSHKFCRFCIDRWINVNPGRRCPICRGGIGVINNLPELDQTIESCLESCMTPEELFQRNAVRASREAIRLAASRMPVITNNINDFFESHESLSLETQLVSNALRNSIQAAEHEFQLQNVRFLESINNVHNDPNNLFQNSSDNPWTAQSTANIINRLRQSISRLQEFQDPFVSYNVQTQQGRSEHETRGHEPTAEQVALLNENRQRSIINQSVNRVMSGMSSNGGNTISQNWSYNHRSRRQCHMRSIIEDDLVSEYNYHLRRIESAYARVQEAQRDHEFHTGELMSIYDEFVSNQSGRMEDLSHAYDHDPNFEEYQYISRGRSRGLRTATPTSRMTSTTSTQHQTDDESDTPSMIRRLRRMNTRWQSVEEQNSRNNNNYDSHRPFPPSLRGQRSHGRLDLESNDPSTMILPQTPSEYQQAENSQTLRITREEVNLPQGERDEGIQSQSFRSILSAINCRSPIRSWSELSRGRRTNDPVSLISSGNRQGRRRSVQFQIQRDMDGYETIIPDHEISAPTPENSQPQSRRNSSNSRPRSSTPFPFGSNSNGSTQTRQNQPPTENDNMIQTQQIDNNNNPTSLDSVNSNSRQRYILELQKQNLS